jgi:hypothetical protein
MYEHLVPSRVATPDPYNDTDSALSLVPIIEDGKGTRP